jgi:fatty acid desaturase
MIPEHELLEQFQPTNRLTESARPAPAFREELRKIPNFRNACNVILVYAQTIGIIVAAVWIDNWFVWIAAFLLMGRAHAQFAALMHEAAHRLLFRNKKINDWVGRWLLGFPAFTPTDLYRRGHMAHHRDEFGPDEPDIPLYRGYPIQSDSLRRKLVRDATGRTGWKLFKGLLRGVASSDAKVRSQARGIVGTQLVLIAIGIALGHPWVYLILWLAPYLTVWRVINRLRSIAEHGGMQRSKDRRLTTHTVKQSPASRFALVPFHIGWHLAHHVDSGVPMANLPKLHAELRRAGYVTDGLEYPSYAALWRKLGSHPRIDAAA